MTKPKRTSITVTVRNGEDFRATRPGKRYEARGYDFSRVLEYFPRTPSPPYLLKYSLNPRGHYLVDCEDSYPRIFNLGMNKYYLIACFLPRDWHGLRVSRKGEAI